MKPKIPTQQEEALAKTSPLSLKLSVHSRKRLSDLAAHQRRPAHALAREAVEAYISTKEEQIQRDQEAEASWKHYQDTGLHIDGREAIAWLRSLATATPLPKPQVRCEK